MSIEEIAEIERLASACEYVTVTLSRSAQQLKKKRSSN